LLFERVDAIVERAYAGKNHGFGIGHFVRLLRDPHFSANLQQRLVDAAQVSGTIIEERNHAQSLRRDATVRNRLRTGGPGKGGRNQLGDPQAALRSTLRTRMARSSTSSNFSKP